MSEDPATGEQGYFEVVAVTSHAEDELLQITIEAEAEQGSKGAEEQGSNSLDSGSDTIDNTGSQLNSGDDQQSKIQNLKSKMEVTPEHPVYVEGKGWLWAENPSTSLPSTSFRTGRTSLSIGDQLRRADGGLARLALDEHKTRALLFRQRPRLFWFRICSNSWYGLKSRSEASSDAERCTQKPRRI